MLLFQKWGDYVEQQFLSKLIITKVRSAMTVFTEENAWVKRTNRPCWAIILKYEGETVYTVGKKNIISNANNPVILPKGSSYEWKCVKRGCYAIVEFDCDLTDSNIFAFHIKNSENLLKQFKYIEYAITSKAPMYELRSIKDTYSIILEVTKNYVANYINSDKKQKIQPAIDFIAKNFNKEIRNERLAKECNMSNIYFRKLFKEITGTSPIAYTHHLRITKAQEMLAGDYTKISDIAQNVGYSSIYHFSKMFKKHTGFSPSEYKKQF